MRQIILDLGSGNTCQNKPEIIQQMIDAVPDIPNHEVIIKWQLFKKAGNNIPLIFENFDFAYNYAKAKGFQTTASVFDAASLRFLQCFDVPFIKIANRPDLYPLINHIPRNIMVYASWDGSSKNIPKHSEEIIPCISKYPATMHDYLQAFSINQLESAFSDHTVGTALYKTFRPYIWEKHFRLPDSTGLDAGLFAITPEELEELFLEEREELQFVSC